VGASRKSMIGMILDRPAEDRLNGTLAITAYCSMHDVDIIRVHDVRENVEVVRVIEAIKNADKMEENKKVGYSNMSREDVRLDRFLSNAHVGTRSEVRDYIRNGMVEVNSRVIKDPAYHVSDKDIITLDGEQVSGHRNVYILLHKPAGYVSTTSENEPSVLNLVDHPYLGELHIAGRLDKDVEGLLILTNDGDFTHKLISPKRHVEKEYYIYTTKPAIVSDYMKQLVENGMILDDGTKTMPGQE